jgi:hypothetical protein
VKLANTYVTTDVAEKLLQAVNNTGKPMRRNPNKAMRFIVVNFYQME